MQTTQQTSSILKLTVIAFIVAAIALVTLILPAEYGIDPTGLGKATGVGKLHLEASSEPQAAPAKSLQAPVAVPVAAQASQPSLVVSQREAVLVNVPAGRGVEYKLQVGKFEKITYEWVADADLYFDLHGEPKGDTTGYFESYAIATAPKMKGQFVTPFAGSHGWYWKNKTDKPIQVQLTFEGNFTHHGLK